MLVAKRAFTLLFLCLRFVVSQSDTSLLPTSWENVQYSRTVDVSRSYTQESIDLQIKNVDDKPISEYYFVLPEDVFEKISLFSAKLRKVDAILDSAILPQQTFTANGKAVKVGVVQLPSPIEPGQEAKIVVNIAYNCNRQPYPGHVELGEKQSLRLSTNKYPISAYNTKTYSLGFKGSLSFSEQESVGSDAMACQMKGNTFSCVSQESVAAYRDPVPISVVFEHNLPLTRVTNLERAVWISHWASTLQFEEYYELINDAAPLKSGFSRAEYMRGQHALKQSGHLTALEMVLPEDSEEHYFTDLVGAVSTFKVLKNHLFLKPRYPLFGGWKYNFTIGWTNQLSQFLRVEDATQESYVLSVPALNGPDDTFYDRMNLSVYLPEEAEVLDVWCPLPITSTEVTTEKSYFDLNKGHTKVSLELKNVVDTVARSEVFIRYKFSSTSFYKKPFSIATSVFVVLMAYYLLKQTTYMIEE
ncbi:LANO_0E14576g1_1 [Lachancea nothofagi CBS 11611]|uniref:Dolichyl-diphosphooligosaccharide--protein glycosyltransferase subunit 1 n=1 Tax=Lachancea nothofagi CBS 11611 TaxID=1266666 RepID=A0A1G4K058_9SACH|nr:LANO_0E14576g1_1 [Lachancea nothofagi CBS 11611]